MKADPDGTRAERARALADWLPAREAARRRRLAGRGDPAVIPEWARCGACGEVESHPGSCGSAGWHCRRCGYATHPEAYCPHCWRFAAPALSTFTMRT